MKPTLVRRLGVRHTLRPTAVWIVPKLVQVQQFKHYRSALLCLQVSWNL